MNWIILIGVSGVVLITDGRYVGKPVTRWIDNRIGLRGHETMVETAVGDLTLRRSHDVIVAQRSQS